MVIACYFTFLIMNECLLDNILLNILLNIFGYPFMITFNQLHVC